MLKKEKQLTSIDNDQFNKLEKWFGFYKYSNLIEVDFDKPIWDIYKSTKGLLFIVSICVLIREIATALLPGVLVFIILSQSFSSLVYLAILALVVTIVFYLEYYFAAILLNKLTFSVHFSAQKFFLTTDPINQSTRSSGQIISKVERGSNSVSTLVEVSFVDLLPMVATMLASLIPLYFFDFKIGFWLSVFLVIIVIFNTYFRLYVVDKFQPIGIKFEDIFKAVSVENLSQVMLIRSVFSSEDQIKKQSNNGKNAASKWATVWQLLHSSDLIMYFLSYVSIAVLSWYLLTNPNIFSQEVAVALVTNYIFAINKLSLAGSRIKKFAVNKANLEDLFKFIRNFGKQTFPVLENEKLTINNEK